MREMPGVHIDQNRCSHKSECAVIDVSRYGAGKFAGFNGRKQSWLREQEYLIGPQLPPVIEQ